MKTNFYRPILMVIYLFLSLPSFAQADRKIKLQLTDPSSNKSQTYLLKTFAYSCSRPSEDSLYVKQYPYNSYMLSLDFKQDMDPFLLKWIAGDMNEADGLITVESENNQKATRTIAFKGGMAGVTSETFSSGDSYYASAQVSVYTKRLIIDNVEMYSTIKKASADTKKQ